MNYDFTNRAKMITYVLMGIGLIAVIMGFVSGSHASWANLLASNFFFLGIGLFGIIFISKQYLAQGGYGVIYKRVPEAMSQYVLVGGPIMLLILIAGNHHIYHWMADGIMDDQSEYYDKIIAAKEAFLNKPFFYARSFIYVGGWMWAAYALRKLSLQQDLNGGIIFHNKSITAAALFVVFFAVTVCTSSWDWIMSIDAHWFSTLFGWYILAGLWASGAAALILFIVYLKNKGYLQAVNDNHLGDIGKWMFAVSLIWAYLWFSQFMLIWYANIPEEVTYFQMRIENYRYIYFGMMLVNFCFPFFVLASRDAKRNPGFIVTVAIFILLGHFADTFIMVMGGTVGAHWSIGFVEIGTFLGFLGLFLFVVQRSLAKASINIESHPFLEESVHLHH